MTPEEFVKGRKKFQDQIAIAYAEIKKMHAEVDNTLPTNLRPATAHDIIKGAVIWYKNGDNGPFWTIIEEVRYPRDPFKAYYAEDGSSYGLDDAWVTTNKPTGETPK